MSKHFAKRAIGEVIALKYVLKNGWAKNLMHSVIDCVRSNGLCERHRDSISIYVAF